MGLRVWGLGLLAAGKALLQQYRHRKPPQRPGRELIRARARGSGPSVGLLPPVLAVHNGDDRTPLLEFLLRTVKHKGNIPDLQG